MYKHSLKHYSFLILDISQVNEDPSSKNLWQSFTSISYKTPISKHKHILLHTYNHFKLYPAPTGLLPPRTRRAGNTAGGRQLAQHPLYHLLLRSNPITSDKEVSWVQKLLWILPLKNTSGWQGNSLSGEQELFHTQSHLLKTVVDSLLASYFLLCKLRILKFFIGLLNRRC